RSSDAALYCIPSTPIRMGSDSRDVLGAVGGRALRPEQSNDEQRDAGDDGQQVETLVQTRLPVASPNTDRPPNSRRESLGPSQGHILQDRDDDRDTEPSPGSPQQDRGDRRRREEEPSCHDPTLDVVLTSNAW